MAKVVANRARGPDGLIKSVWSKYNFAILMLIGCITSWILTRQFREEPLLQSINRIELNNNIYHIHHFVIGAVLSFINGDLAIILLWIYRDRINVPNWIIYAIITIQSWAIGMFFDQQYMWLYLKSDDPERNKSGLLTMLIWRLVAIIIMIIVTRFIKVSKQKEDRH